MTPCSIRVASCVCMISGSAHDFIQSEEDVSVENICVSQYFAEMPFHAHMSHCFFRNNFSKRLTIKIIKTIPHVKAAKCAQR